MIWEESSLYLAGLKEIYRNTSTKMEPVLCSFATVTAIHLASRWDWHHNNEHKELLTESVYQHTIRYIKGNNVKSKLTHLLHIHVPDVLHTHTHTHTHTSVHIVCIISGLYDVQ